MPKCETLEMKGPALIQYRIRKALTPKVGEIWHSRAFNPPKWLTLDKPFSIVVLTALFTIIIYICGYSAIIIKTKHAYTKPSSISS